MDECSFSMLRLFFDSVRKITTDMGTERHMARARDMLLDFCGAIGVAVPAGARPLQYLMPRALLRTWLPDYPQAQSHHPAG